MQAYAPNAILCHERGQCRKAAEITGNVAENLPSTNVIWRVA